MSKAEAKRRARAIVVKYIESTGVVDPGRLTASERALIANIAAELQSVAA